MASEQLDPAKAHGQVRHWELQGIWRDLFSLATQLHSNSVDTFDMAEVCREEIQLKVDTALSRMIRLRAPNQREAIRVDNLKVSLVILIVRVMRLQVLDGLKSSVK